MQDSHLETSMSLLCVNNKHRNNDKNRHKRQQKQRNRHENEYSTHGSSRHHHRPPTNTKPAKNNITTANISNTTNASRVTQSYDNDRIYRHHSHGSNGSNSSNGSSTTYYNDSNYSHPSHQQSHQSNRYSSNHTDNSNDHYSHNSNHSHQSSNRSGHSNRSNQSNRSNRSNTNSRGDRAPLQQRPVEHKLSSTASVDNHSPTSSSTTNYHRHHNSARGSKGSKGDYSVDYQEKENYPNHNYSNYSSSSGYPHQQNHHHQQQQKQEQRYNQPQEKQQHANQLPQYSSSLSNPSPSSSSVTSKSKVINPYKTKKLKQNTNQSNQNNKSNQHPPIHPSSSSSNFNQPPSMHQSVNQMPTTTNTSSCTPTTTTTTTTTPLSPLSHTPQSPSTTTSKTNPTPTKDTSPIKQTNQKDKQESPTKLNVKGPNQTLYLEKYDDFVCSILEQHKYLLRPLSNEGDDIATRLQNLRMQVTKVDSLMENWKDVLDRSRSRVHNDSIPTSTSMDNRCDEMDDSINDILGSDNTGGSNPPMSGSTTTMGPPSTEGTGGTTSNNTGRTSHSISHSNSLEEEHGNHRSNTTNSINTNFNTDRRSQNVSNESSSDANGSNENDESMDLINTMDLIQTNGNTNRNSYKNNTLDLIQTNSNNGGRNTMGTTTSSSANSIGNGTMKDSYMENDFSQNGGSEGEEEKRNHYHHHRQNSNEYHQSNDHHSRRSTKQHSHSAIGRQPSTSHHPTYSLSPVEIVREADHHHQHPELKNLDLPELSMQSPPISTRSSNHAAYRKRLASTSGKKGMERQRTRYSIMQEDEIHHEEQEEEDHLDSYCNTHPDMSMREDRSYEDHQLRMELEDSKDRHNEYHDHHHRQQQGEGQDYHSDMHKYGLDDSSRHSGHRDSLELSPVCSPHQSSSSPTSQHSTHSSPLHHDRHCSDRYNQDRHHSKHHDGNDSIESLDSPHQDISMREDSRFYLDPLRVYHPPKEARSYGESSRRGHSPKVTLSSCIPDPFKEFGTRTSERLEVVLEWLNERDYVENSGGKNQSSSSSSGASSRRNVGSKMTRPNSKGSAVLLAFTLAQIQSLVLNMCLQNGVHPAIKRAIKPGKGTKRTSTHEKGKEPTQGGTLLIVRNKEDLAEWLSQLREKTSFSVLNHAEIVSSERRRTSAAGYDVVLTTYEAIKAKEVVMQVDDCGRSLSVDETKSQDGWYSSRSSVGKNGESQAQNCKLLSTLHGLEWHRVIFVDVLGRSSFLTKPGTSRIEAAIGVKAQSRIIFFMQTSENRIFEDKLKDSRRQLVALANVLDLPDNRVMDKIVGEAMLDFYDVKENDNNPCESSFSSNDYISEG